MDSLPKPVAVVIKLVLVLAVIYSAILISRKPVKLNSETDDVAKVLITEEVASGNSSATLAGGCFWCTEAVLQELDGVSNVISGYGGGTEFNPTYEQVYTETTSHREAVRVFFDPEIISFSELLDVYLRSIDPTDDGGQFVDKGKSYTAAIFYENEVQKKDAQQALDNLAESGRFDEPIVTKLLPFTTFYQAEDYHQDFYLNSAERYKNYASNSGRDEFKAEVWAEIQKTN